MPKQGKYMHKIISFFSPVKILALFILVVLSCIIINYLSQNSDLSVRYDYVKRAKMFDLFCFIPSMAFFLGVSTLNFSISKSRGDKRNMKISLIPLYFMGLFGLCIILLLSYIFIRDIIAPPDNIPPY